MVLAAMATTRDPTHESVNLLTLLPQGLTLLDVSDPAYPAALDTTRWLYHEPTGLLTNKVYADGKGTSYSYTPDGKLATRIWARHVGNDPAQPKVATAYGYTPSGELHSITYNDGTSGITNQYDRPGRQIGVVDGTGEYAYVYDPATLALAEEHFPDGTVLTRAQDTLGRPAGIALGSGYAVAYGYDAFARFQSVTSAQSADTNTWGYSYLPGSHLLSSVSNNLGLVVARFYEPHRDLITAVSNTFGGTLVSAFDYTNDALGRRTARADSGSAFASTQANAFGYNVRSEVASAAMRNGESTYTFDPIGNRTEATLPEEPQPLVYASNPLNQYTNIVAGGVASVPIHDEDGNMLSGPAGPAGAALSMVWDGENRLVAVTNGNTLVVSDYDYRSRRTRKRVYSFADDAWSLSADHRYLYDRWNLIRETIGNQQSAITNSFVWGLDLSGSLQGAGGIGGLLSLHSSPLPLGEGQGEGGAIAPYYPTFDANGNTSEYLSTNGVVAAHYEYDAFGRTIAQSGDLADSFLHRFSTKYLDDETGLYYYGYRYYSAELGRWMSRDPIGERGGLSLYGFVRSNAVGLLDYLGRIDVKFSEDGEPDPTQIRPKVGTIPSHARAISPIVVCTCYCEDESAKPKKYTFACEVSFSFEIFVSTAEASDPSPTLRQIYGHEQRHVVSRTRLVKERMFKAMREATAARTTREDWCKEHAKNAAGHWGPILRDWLKTGDNHKSASDKKYVTPDSPDAPESPHEPLVGTPDWDELKQGTE